MCKSNSDDKSGPNDRIADDAACVILRASDRDKEKVRETERRRKREEKERGRETGGACVAWCGVRTRRD